MIGVPVNDDEYEAIGGKAEVHHMTRAFFLRHVGLGYRMRRPSLRSTISHTGILVGWRRTSIA
jgi:hypothetical protein